MRIPLLPNNDTTNGWYAILPEHPAPRVLEGDVAADWVVVGAGFAGLAAARRLGELRPNEKVALVEAGRVGMNASGRNSGFVIDLPHLWNTDNPEEGHRQIRLNRTAIAWLQEIVEANQIRCQWSVRGKVHAAATERGRRALDQFCAELDVLDEPYERFDRGGTQGILGTGYYLASVRTPQNVLMQPAALVTGLARSLPENVSLYEDSPVVDAEFGQTKTFKTPKGSVRAPRVIMATNGWTPGFGFLANRLVTVFTFASLTRPLTEAEQQALGGEGDWGVIPATLGGATMRYTQDRRLLMRRELRYAPTLQFDAEYLRRMRRDHHDPAFRNRFPMLPEVAFEYTWGGAMTMARNFAPKWGDLGEGVWAAVCQNGVGAAKGTISGRTVAEYAAGEHNELIEAMRKFDEPVALPPRWLVALGVRGRIALEAFRAKRER